MNNEPTNETTSESPVNDKPYQTPGHEKIQDPKPATEPKKRFQKLHDNNAEFGTEIEESESPETQKLKKVKNAEYKNKANEGDIEKVESTDPAI